MGILLSALEGIKGMSAVSSTYVTWSLSTIGASILAIVSTSYIRPSNKNIRYIYLTFIPGWFFLSLCLYLGDEISRRMTAAAFTTNQDTISDIGLEINKTFSSQINFFRIGISFFMLWLLLYLLWWVMGNWEIKK